METTQAVPPPLPVAALKYTGENAEFRRLVLNGAGLELVTLGFYRFWLATRIRRHLWAHTQIDGDLLEYLGTGRELLIGFLFAVALLAPFYFGYFLLGIEAERYRQFASAPLGVLYYGFLQFAIYRGRRYRLNRTIWRGLRFGMDGSGTVYALKSMLWGLAVIFSFGLAYPWREAALERHKMKHTFYGGMYGEFVGTGGGLFRSLWWLYACVILAGVLMVGVGVLVAQKQAPQALPAILLLAFAVCFPFALAAFRASEWKWWVDGLRIGPVAARSGLGRADLMRYYWAIVGFFFVAILALGAVVGGVWSVFADELKSLAKGGRPPVLAMIMFAVPYLAVLLGFTAVMRIYIIQRVWKAIVNSTAIFGLDRIGDVFARDDNVTALGEGIADGFDIMGF